MKVCRVVGNLTAGQYASLHSIKEYITGNGDTRWDARCGPGCLIVSDERTAAKGSLFQSAFPSRIGALSLNYAFGRVAMFVPEPVCLGDGQEADWSERSKYLGVIRLAKAMGLCVSDVPAEESCSPLDLEAFEKAKERRAELLATIAPANMSDEASPLFSTPEEEAE